jgi:hypothetical protein
MATTPDLILTAEVLLRFWLRDQQAIAQDRAAPGVGSEVKAGRTRRRSKS